MGRDDPGDVVELIQRAGQAQQHDTGSPHELGRQWKRPIGVREGEVVGVGGKRALPGEGILMNADAGGARERGAERERAVRVADDAHGGRFGVLARRCGAVEDESVGGVDRDQPRGLEVGAPP